MCGIFACHKCFEPINQFKPTALQASKALRHRGPDWSGNVVKNNTILCHERLAIVGVGKYSPVTVGKHLITWRLDSGAQPITNEDSTLILADNGEIYNHRALRKSLKHPHKFKSHSDCEVILPPVLSPYNSILIFSTMRSACTLLPNWMASSVSSCTMFATDEIGSSPLEIPS